MGTITDPTPPVITTPKIDPTHVELVHWIEDYERTLSEHRRSHAQLRSGNPSEVERGMRKLAETTRELLYLVHFLTLRGVTFRRDGQMANVEMTTNGRFISFTNI